MENLKERIDLINLIKTDQTTEPEKHKLELEENGWNFETHKNYKLNSYGLELVNSVIDDDLVEEVNRFLFHGNVKIKYDAFYSKIIYFLNSKKLEVDITNIYTYLEKHDSIGVSEFINDVFSYSIMVDQNGYESLENTKLEELILILKNIEHKSIKSDEDIQNLIEEFKTLISPNNEMNYETSQFRFEVLCKKFKNCGYKIQVYGLDYFDFTKTELRKFAYDKIRSSIIERDTDTYTGNVSWQSRRDFIKNDMIFVSNQQILSSEVIKELEEINFTDVNDTNLDQTLCDIINYIENKLKDKKKYVDLTKSESYTSKLLASTLVSQDLIREYRSQLQCFRHHSEHEIEKRNSFSDDEKKILIAYGHSICLLIRDVKK